MDNWFNTAAYARAAQGTFGTAGRQPYLELRAEAFNVLNHPNWGEPNTTLSNVAFGRISSTRGDMRQIQFGLKLIF